MAQKTATLAFDATLKGGAKATFKALSSGLRSISTELKKTAKDLLKMGDVSAANAVGSVSMAVGGLSEKYKKLGSSSKEAAKETSSAFKEMGEGVKSVQGLWAHYEKTSNKTAESTKANAAQVKNLSKNLGVMAAQLTAGGADGDKWLQNLTKGTLLTALSNKTITKTGKILDDLSKSRQKDLNITRDRSKAYEKSIQTQSLFHTVAGKSIKRTDEYQKAVQNLGRQFKYVDKATKVWVPVLDKVESAMIKVNAATGTYSASVRKSIRDANLTKVSQQVLAGNLKVTANGFQALNSKGLEPFNKLSYSAAKNAGMLSKGFDNLSVKEGAKSFTELSKAYKEAATRGEGYRKGLENLAKTNIGVSADLKTRVGVLQKIDTAHRKLTDTLQRNGKITVAEMQRQNQVFDANAFSIKKGSKALEALGTSLSKAEGKAIPLSTAIKNMAKDTGLSTKAITAHVKALSASGKSEAEVIGKLSKAKKTLLSQDKELVKIQKDRANATNKSIESIKLETVARQKQSGTINKRIQANTELINSQSKVLAKEKETQNNLKKSESAIRSLKAEFKSLKGNPEFEKSLANITKEYKNHKEAGAQAVKEARKIGKAMQEVSKPTNMFADGLKRVGRSIKSFAAYAVGASIIAGFAMTIRSATEAIIDFDQSLKDLQAITTSTEREVSVMGAKILEVAGSTKFSAQEVALGMKTLGQAGLSASESVKTIEAVANLATGTLTDMGTAVDLVTTAMRVFEIDSANSAHISDVFANAVNRSKLTVEKLRIALNYVGPISQRIGISFEELASSMMVLANSGIRASTIGTGLRQVFNKLVNPSKQFAEGVYNAGLSMDDFNPKLQSMEKIIENLSHVVVTAEDAFTMFGLRGSSAVLALTNAGTSNFLKMYDAVNKTGSAAKMAEVQMEGLAVKIKNMWDKTKNLAIALGDSGLAWALHKVVNGARNVTDALIYLARDPIASLIMQVGAVTVAFGLLLSTFKALATFTSLQVFFTALKTFFIGLPGSVTKASASMGIYSAATATATATTTTFTAAIKASTIALLKNPFGLVAVAIGVFVAAVVGLITVEKRRLRLIQEQIDKSKGLVDAYTDQAKSIDEYRKNVIKAGDDSARVKNLGLSLKKSLYDIADASAKAGGKQAELSDYAIKAAQSIDNLTGKVKEGSTAIGDYRDKLKQFKTDEVINSFDLVIEKIEETSSTWDKWKRSLSHGFKVRIPDFFDNHFNLFKKYREMVDSLGVGLGALFDPIMKKYPAFSKMFNWMDTKLTSLINKIKKVLNIPEGKFSFFGKNEDFDVKDDYLKKKIDFETYAKTVESWEGKKAKAFKKTRDELFLGRTEAAKLLLELENLGKIDGSSTEKEILKAAKASEKSRMQVDFLKEAISNLHEFGSSSGMASWAEGIIEGTDTSVQKIVDGNDIIKDSLAELDQAKIESHDADLKTLAEKVLVNDKKMESDSSYVKEGTALQAKYQEDLRLLRIKERDDLDLAREKQLKQVAIEHQKKLAALKVTHRDLLDSSRTKQTALINLERETQKKIQKIMADTYDPAIMKRRLKDFISEKNALLSASLLDIKLESSGDREGTEAGVYRKRELQTILNHHKVLEAKHKEHYEALLLTEREGSAALNEAKIAYQNSQKNSQKAELDLLDKFVEERNKIQDKIKDITTERTEATATTAAKIKTIETTAANEIVAINNDKEQKIAALLESRAAVAKKVNSDIASNEASIKDKIANIRQRGMSDEQKERDNRRRADQKYAQGRRQVQQALSSGDKELLDLGKQSLKGAESLYEGLANSGAAISGLRKVGDAYNEAIKAGGTIEIAGIDKEIQNINRVADIKIKNIEFTRVQALKAEHERHNLVMQNLDKELQKEKEKLKLTKQLIADTKQSINPTAPAPAPTNNTISQGADGVWRNMPSKAEIDGINLSLSEQVAIAQKLEDEWVKINKEAQGHDKTVGEMADSYATDLMQKMDSLKTSIENGEEVDIPVALGELQDLKEEYDRFKEALKGSPIIDSSELSDELEVAFYSFIDFIKEQDPAEISAKIDEASLRAADRAIKDLEQTIIVKVETKAIGGQVGAISRAKGGRIPGADSKKDNTLVHARSGEWFIRNESVKTWTDSVGSWFMNAVNAPMSSAGKHLMDIMKNDSNITVPKAGFSSSNIKSPQSSKSTSDSFQDFGTVNFTFPDNKESIPVLMKPNDVGKLLGQLDNMRRFAS